MIEEQTRSLQPQEEGCSCHTCWTGTCENSYFWCTLLHWQKKNLNTTLTDNVISHICVKIIEKSWITFLSMHTKYFQVLKLKLFAFELLKKITQKVPISQNEVFSPCLFLTIKDESCSLVKFPNTLSDICDFFLTLSNTPSSPQHEASSTADSQFSRELIWFPRQALVTLFFLEEVHESRDSLFSTLGESELSQYLFSSSIIWWTKQPGKSARIFS